MDDTQGRIAASFRALQAINQQKQVELAEVLGLSQRSVSLKLRGEVAWSAVEVEKLAGHFDVTYAQILAGPRAWLRAVEGPRGEVARDGGVNHGYPDLGSGDGARGLDPFALDALVAA